MVEPTELRPWPWPGPYDRSCVHFEPDETKTARLWAGRCGLTRSILLHALCAAGNPGHVNQPYAHRSAVCVAYEPYSWKKPDPNWPTEEEWNAVVSRRIR